MENLEIRMTVSDKKIHYVEIAKKLNVSREWLSRLMRKKLSTEWRCKIWEAIKQIEKERQVEA